MSEREPSAESSLTPDQVAKLKALKEKLADGNESTPESRRLEFIRWLYKNKRIGAGDNQS